MMKMKLIKIFISMTFALIAAMLGVFAVAITKAIVPIFSLTAGTTFETYVQDPILYFLTPLFCGYITFRKIMRKNISKTVLTSIALASISTVPQMTNARWRVLPVRLAPSRWITG
jgi:hypothetical protein